MLFLKLGIFLLINVLQSLEICFVVILDIAMTEIEILSSFLGYKFLIYDNCILISLILYTQSSTVFWIGSTPFVFC